MSLWMLVLSLLLGVGWGCSSEPTAPAEGPRLTIVEKYEGDSVRQVSIAATLVPEQDGVVGLADVSIRLTPGDEGMVRKLEAVLDDAALRVRPGSWPVPARSLPAQAMPALQRVQLALAALEPQDMEIDTPLVEVFDGPATVGLTRMQRSGDRVSVQSLALAASDTGKTLAFGHLTGTMSADAGHLSGERMVGSVRERVHLTITRDAPGGRPAPVRGD